MRILVINCGSSSLKLRLFDLDGGPMRALAEGAVERIGPGATLVFREGERVERREEAIGDWGAALGRLLDLLGDERRDSIEGIGHRVVHGGALREPAIIDDGVVAAIEGARRFAPLHNGPSLEGIHAARAHLPGVPMVAVFDTAFHASMPDVGSQYALPRDVAERYGVRRYGYHGIAHRSMSERFAELTGTPPDDVSIITLQLGNGCSAAAVRGRGSVDTSMGFTPLEGLMMGTRSGDVDAAVVTYLVREHGMAAEEVDAMLNHRSGLLGVSGSSGDMAELLGAEARGDARARAAVELFCYRVRKQIGAYMAALGTTQAVVSGGGIGERSPEVRRRILAPLGALRLRLDETRNAAVVGAEGRISADGSAVAAWVIPSDEERVIARDAYEALAAQRGQGIRGDRGQRTGDRRWSPTDCEL